MILPTILAVNIEYYYYGIVMHSNNYTLYIICMHCHAVPLNPCLTTNGGCSHFCLLSAVDPRHYSCDCPEGLLLSNDLANCTFHNGTTTVLSPLRLGIIIIENYI